jgi:hypothetical protein
VGVLANRWRITVTRGLSAHFYTESGVSKPGSDWAVSLKRGRSEKRILVRIYDDNVARGELQQTHAIIAFVARLIDSGWTPDDYKAQPGELVVPTQFRPRPEDYQPKPWWRFW